MSHTHGTFSEDSATGATHAFCPRPLFTPHPPNAVVDGRAEKSAPRTDVDRQKATSTTSPSVRPAQYKWLDMHSPPLSCAPSSSPSVSAAPAPARPAKTTAKASPATMMTASRPRSPAPDDSPTSRSPTSTAAAPMESLPSTSDSQTQPPARALLGPDDLRDADFHRETYLGEGSYSIVTLATHTPSNRVFALKEMHCARLRALGVSDQLQWEINVHRRLRHANIVRLYSYYYTQEDDCIRLVLEYCPRGNLHQYVHSRPRGCLDEAHASRFTRHIARAVAYLHQHKLVHRDLKLENVLLDHHHVAKLADFGWSRQLSCAPRLTGKRAREARPVDEVLLAAADHPTPPRPPRADDSASPTVLSPSSSHTPQTRRRDPAMDEAGGVTVGRSTVCGTLDYLSPEMVMHDTHTGKTDVWSLGVMLAEMLTGHTPFYRPAVSDTMAAIRTAAPELTAEGVPSLSADAMSLVMSMLQKEPALRPTMDAVLAHPWLQKRLP